MGEAAALIAALTWSGTSVAMASLSARVTPVAMSALRLSVASLLLPLALLLSGQTGAVADAPASAIWAMIGSGILAYALGDTLYIAALKSLGVQRAFTVSMTLFILLSVAGGIVLLDEEFHWYQIVGSAFVGAGILLIVRGRSSSTPAGAGRNAIEPSVHRRRLLRLVGAGGYGAVIAVAILWAAATLWLAHGRGDLPSIAAATLRTPAGALCMLAYAGIAARADLAAPFRSRRDLAAIALVGLIGTAFGSLLYVYAVGEAGPGKTTVLSAAAPLMALPLSFVVLRETITRQVVAGTVLAVCGIVLVVV